jgi:methionyl-tRNA formyltransferase
MNAVDLYLGGPIGLWALQSVEAASVRRVFTLNDDIAAAARGAGIEAFTENANKVEFAPSPVALSVHYQRLIRAPLLSKYAAAYNLHPGYLPWGRGYYPVFWALWEGTPAGATLHEMVADVDEGPIVAQVRVDTTPEDTGETVYRRVHEAERSIFREFWPRILAGDPLPSAPQPPGGTYHPLREFLALKRDPDLDAMSARDLLRLVRCLTFPGYSGLEITLGGRLYELHLEPIEGETP